MRIIITGGGTGGHIYPAIAVAQEIKRRWPETEILFVGTERGIESRAVPSAGFDIKFVNSAGLSTKPGKLAKFVFSTGNGVVQSLFIINSFKPDLLIGSGGFVSAPVLFAGAIKRLPIVILEQNVLPGKTNRFLSRWAKKILISFEGSKNFLPEEKVFYTGNPIRRDIIERDRMSAFKSLNLTPDRFTLLITGASQGARSINEAVIKNLPAWKGQGWQILHLVGKKDYESVCESVKPLLSGFNGEYRAIDYTEDMASLYAVADAVIARSGASTLAEITARGIPAVLIPYPYAADNHQEKNARWLEEAGAVFVINDEDAGDMLDEYIMMLFKDRSKRENMARASRKMGKPEALDEIMAQLEGFFR